MISKLLAFTVAFIAVSAPAALASVEMPNASQSFFGAALTGPLSAQGGNAYSVAMIIFFLIASGAAPLVIVGRDAWQNRRAADARTPLPGGGFIPTRPDAAPPVDRSRAA